MPRPKKQEPETVGVLLKDAEFQEMVDPKKAYTFTLQFGPTVRWRQYGGGKWVRDEKNDKGTGRAKQSAYRLELMVHENVGPFSGAIVNGFVQANNDFIQHCREDRNPDEDINRMRLVYDIEEVDVPPLDRQNLGRITRGDIENIAAGVTKAVIKELMQSSRKRGE